MHGKKRATKPSLENPRNIHAIHINLTSHKHNPKGWEN
jgi:hypothetical protein